MRYLLVLLLLAGCSTVIPMWSRNGATEQVFNSEAKQCETQARTIAAALDAPIETYNATEATRAFYACMRGKGWSVDRVTTTGKDESSFQPDDDRCSKMYHRGPAWLECMQAAGWRLPR